MFAASVATYIWGQCTAFVAGALSWVPGGLGNAFQWPERAAAKGYPVGKQPHVGDVAVWPAGFGGAGSFGHVAAVTGVSGGSITVQEQNWSGGPGVTDTRIVPRGIANSLTFISPKGTTQSGNGLLGTGIDVPNPLDGIAGAVTGFGTLIQKGAVDLSISVGFFMLALILIFAGLLFMVFSTNAGRSAAKEGVILATV